MGWARDIGRIYTLAAGAFCVVTFFETMLLAAVESSFLVAVCAAVSVVLVIIGSFLIYFGLEIYDSFFDTVTGPVPARLQPGYPDYWSQYSHWYYYQYLPWYYRYYYSSYYSPQEYRAYYFQYPEPRHRPGGGLQAPWSGGPAAGAAPAPARVLELPPAWILMTVFLIAVLAGGASLALRHDAPGATVLIFPIAFVIGFSFPSLIWISHFYSFDREPAPARAVLLALTVGMLSTIPALYVNSLAQAALGGEAASALSLLIVAAAVAPFTEELCKASGIYAVRERVRGRLDGLIFGVTAGMGFALIENLTYELSFLFTGEDPVAVWTVGSLARGLGSIVVHAIGAGAIGYAYGRLRVEGAGALSGLPIAYLMAVGLHSAWNGTATVLEGVDWGWAVIIPFMVAFAVGGFLLLRALVDRARAAERSRAAS